MKQLIVIGLIALSILSPLYSAEIVGETKKTEEKLLIGHRRPDNYSISSGIRSSFASEKKENSCARSISPQDFSLKTKNVFANDFLELINETNEKKRMDMLSLNPSLRLFFNAQKNGLLMLGNKTFGWDDFMPLTPEQQENLVTLCNQDPYYSLCVGTSNKLFCEHTCSLHCCGCSENKSYIDLLKSLPTNLKRDLIVDIVDDRVCCMYGTMCAPGMFLNGPIMCCTNGFSISTLMGPTAALVCGLGAFILERIRQQNCSKKYLVDRDMMM